MDKEDEDIELVPEAYLETDYSNLNENEFKENIRNYFSYLIKEGDLNAMENFIKNGKDWFI